MCDARPVLGAPFPIVGDRLLIPLAICVLVGFVVGTFGHIIKSKTLIAIGIGLILIGTATLVIEIGSRGQEAVFPDRR